MLGRENCTNHQRVDDNYGFRMGEVIFSTLKFVVDSLKNLRFTLSISTVLTLHNQILEDPIYTWTNSARSNLMTSTQTPLPHQLELKSDPDSDSDSDSNIGPWTLICSSSQKVLWTYGQGKGATYASISLGSSCLPPLTVQSLSDRDVEILLWKGREEEKRSRCSSPLSKACFARAGCVTCIYTIYAPSQCFFPCYISVVCSTAQGWCPVSPYEYAGPGRHI